MITIRKLTGSRTRFTLVQFAGLVMLADWQLRERGIDPVSVCHANRVIEDALQADLTEELKREELEADAARDAAETRAEYEQWERGPGAR